MANSEFIQKTALVTGACGGLGRAIAEAFLRAGTNVVTCDINDALISSFKDEVSSAYPDCTVVLNLDITQDGNIEKLFAEGEKTFGSIEYVVNNAGRIDKFDPVGDMDKKIWDAVIALNLTAPALVCKTAVNAWLKADKKGSIVNIGSIATFRGFTCGAAYTASKHGLLGLTRNTAAFYGRKKIRANLIMPGAMQTNIGNVLANGVNMEGVDVMRLNFPEQGGMPPVDIAKVAELVLFLCSDAADIINGASMTADGGATAN